MMKKYKFLMIMAFLGVFLSSCVKSSESDKSDFFTDKTEDLKQEPNTLIADLPTLVDSTDFIVFSIRDKKIQERKRNTYDSENWYNNYLDNLIFQNTKTDETHVLTKKKIKIISYERFIDSLYPSLNTTLYQVIDSFPNNQKQETFTALYLSTNNGKNFTKITKASEHLNSWKYIPETENIYFITQDDIDNNRKWDDNDTQSMHSVSINNFKRNDLLIKEMKNLNN